LNYGPETELEKYTKSAKVTFLKCKTIIGTQGEMDAHLSL